MTETKTCKLILGSASPRRLQLLAQIGIVPDVVQGADIDETPRKAEDPSRYVVRVASEKNAALVEQFPDAFILTADTTVAVGTRILGKPETREEAKKMVTLLSGRSHRVFTAVVLRAPNGKIVSRLSDNRVKVKRLSDVELEEFLDSNDWQDAAGAYKIQQSFARYIIAMTGSPSGIIGLPLFETAQILKGLGYGSAA